MRSLRRHTETAAFDGGDDVGSCRDLLASLAAVPDPRKRRGVRHGLHAVLAVAAVAVLAGARSFVAIGEWAADAPEQVLAALGVRRDRISGTCRAPDEATVRRVLAGRSARPKWTHRL